MTEDLKEMTLSLWALAVNVCKKYAEYWRNEGITFPILLIVESRRN